MSLKNLKLGKLELFLVIILIIIFVISLILAINQEVTAKTISYISKANYYFRAN